MVTASEARELPQYAAELDAFHRAHARELRHIIDDLPVSDRSHILDLACGDGSYARLLAQRVGREGMVVGVDSSTEFLRVALQGGECRDAQSPRFLAAAVEALPFPDGAFDLVWCVHSLVSLPEPESVLAESVRVAKPGGTVAVMETDSFHELLLPWPEDLELAIRQAELHAYNQQSRRPDKRYAGRRLRTMMVQAGLSRVRQKTYATDRSWPLGGMEMKFLEQKLSRLRELIWPRLSETDRRHFARLVDPQSEDCLYRQNGFAMTWFDIVCRGTKNTGELGP